ncbi:hypothetical protein HY310_00665 [Candidatus Microgenomates bacterium]|nr:hypothetical protein [Candidatus Microgenomates bacterium]
MADPKKQKYPAYTNPAEILKDTARDVAEVPKAIFDEALAQIGLKPQKKPLMGEINMSSGIHKTNQEIDRKGNNLDAKINQLRNIQNQEKQVFNSKEKAVQDQVAKLMQELHIEVSKLQQQTAQLTQETRSVTVEMTPPKAGIYHLNFIDWVLATLKDLKKTVNESRQWLHVFNQKKKQKGYWNMTKKHGHNFQFSDERSVATSVG